MTAKFAWLLELSMPSGIHLYFAEHKGKMAFIEDANLAIHFETEAHAQHFLNELIANAKSEAQTKFLHAIAVKEHGFHGGTLNEQSL